MTSPNTPVDVEESKDMGSSSAERAALLAPQANCSDAPSVAGWKPIESAPSGQVVVLYWPETPTMFARVSVNMASDHGPHRAPTHWMPMPPAPSSEAPPLGAAGEAEAALSATDELIAGLMAISGHFESSGYAHGRHIDKARIANQAATTLSRLLAERRELEKELAEAREESHELTKALTGLTCNGSEFFVRKGDRYIADIPACVGWVRKTKTAAHERTVEAFFARQAAEGRALKAEAERREMLEALKEAKAELQTTKLMSDVYRDIAIGLGACPKCAGLHGPGPCVPATPSRPPPHKMMG